MALNTPTIQFNYYPLDLPASVSGISGDSTPTDPQVNTPPASVDASNLIPTGGGVVLAGGGLQSSNFSLGNSGWRFDGSGNLEANNGHFRGDITGASGTFSGAITATSGTIGGFTIGATAITGTGVKISSASNASIAFGTTPPTSPTAGTGIYIDKTGLFGLNANTQNFKIDATNGTITVTAGTIGGFTIGATTLTASNLVIDSGNQKITVGNTNKITLDGATGTISSASSTWTLNADGNISGFNKIAIFTTPVTISSSNVETTLVSRSIPGGILSTNNGIKVTMLVDTVGLANNANWTIRFKYGSTTIIATTDGFTNSLGGASSGMQGVLYFYLYANGATNSQFLHYTIPLLSNVGGWQFSDSNFSSIRLAGANTTGTATEDSTGALTLAITAQASSGSASNTFTMRSAIMQKIA